MLTGKILGTDTHTHKADGTEKNAEEKAAFLFAYQSTQAIEKALVKFKEDSEEFKTLTALKAKVDAMKPNDDAVSKLRTDLDAMNIKFKELSEKGLPTQGKTLSAQLKEKKDALRTISKGN